MLRSVVVEAEFVSSVLLCVELFKLTGPPPKTEREYAHMARVRIAKKSWKPLKMRIHDGTGTAPPLSPYTMLKMFK